MQIHVNQTNIPIDALILFILGSLTFCIAFGLSSPALLVNDEWITVNQVNQLASGSQLIENEGKYGSTFEGTVSSYFKSKGSYLAYTLFLPVISLPAVFGIMISGDLFRLILLIIWFLIGISGLFTSLWVLDSLHHRRCVFFLWIIIFLFFGLFLANLYYYQPYASSLIDSPIESAAVILTNEILFAMMTPMIYAIFRNVSMPKKTSLIGAISVVCCSSYLIWSSSAKDHLLVAFLLTAIFLLMSSILRKDSTAKWFFLFFVTGLLCWARTEFGAVIVAGLIIWAFLYVLVIQKKTVFNYANTIKFQFFPGLIGLVIGFIPFLMNNYSITGNPLIPPQYLYLLTGRETWNSILEKSDTTSTDLLPDSITYFQQIIDFFSPNIHNPGVDILKLLFVPENNGVGILFICPIILPALLFLCINYSSVKKLYSHNVRLMLIFSFFIAAFTVLGYLRVLSGSIESYGSLPDMRYFSPLYLPLGIISILLLSPVINSNAERWLRYLLITICFGAPTLVLITLMYLYGGITFQAYVNVHIRLLLVIILLLFGIAACSKKVWRTQRVLPVFFMLLVLIPSAFQFFFVVVNALSKINGYLYWQPVLQYLFTDIFLVMG